MISNKTDSLVMLGSDSGGSDHANPEPRTDDNEQR